MGIMPHKPVSLNTQPFFIRKGPVGCLLIHGFTGVPDEMRVLGDFLASKDITVHGIQLPGHGTIPDDMISTTWKDWAGAAEESLLDLRKKCEEVFVAGLSMGGCLTLYLAEKYDLPGAASLAGAVIVDDWRVKYLLPFFGPFIHYYPKGKRTDFVDQEAAAKHKSYDLAPVPCVRSLLQLTNKVRTDLPKIKCPLLIMHSHKDETLGTVNAQHIYDHVSSEKKELVWLERCGHVIPLDIEKQIAFDKIYALISRESKILNK